MRKDRRGVSEVLGYALVFGLVVSTVALVTVGGLGQLAQTRDVEQINNAERAFDLLATNMNDVALRGAPSRATEMRLSNAQLDVPTPVTVRIRADNATGTYYDENESVVPIVYRSSNTDTAIVYSAGAVFRVPRTGGVTVREPSIVAREGRILLPLVKTRSGSVQSIGGGQTARVRANSEQRKLLLSDVDGDTETLFVNVTSPRAALWQDTLDAYEAFDCELHAESPPRASCRAENPERIQIVQIQIGVSLDT